MTRLFAKRQRRCGELRWRVLPTVAAGLTLLLVPEAWSQQPPILEPGGPRAASELEADPSCNSDEFPSGQVLLRWRPAEEPGSQLQVHITIFREGFETGRYTTIRDLEPDATELVFEQVAGQALHRWRVLSLHPEGLVPSETARFEGPICVRDEAEEEGRVPS